MEIKNIIVHEIQKEPNVGQVETVLRENENPIDELSNDLIESLSTLFGKTGLSFGQFGLTGGVRSRFHEALENLVISDGGIDNLSNEFLNFSREATGFLAEILPVQARG